MRLDPAERVPVTLHLVDPDGEAVATATFRLAGPKGERFETEVADGAVLELPLASGERVDVDLWAPGFDRVRLPGLVVAALPDPWTIELSRLRGITGVVLHDGDPVEAASVRLTSQAGRGHAYLRGPDVDLVHMGWLAGTPPVSTGPEGRFHLGTDSGGNLAVAVSHAELGSAVELLTDYAPESGWPDLVIELERTGSVRGVVRDHRGEPVAGASVVLDHPCHELLSTRARADGSFLFERVTAGGWFLQSADPTPPSRISDSTWTPEGWEFPVNCEVRPGVETWSDIALPDPEHAALGGRIVVRGAGADALDVATWSRGSGSARGLVSRVELEPVGPLDAEGHFETRLRPGHDHGLWVTVPGVGAPFRREIPEASLPATVELDVDLARLELTRGAALPKSPRDHWGYVRWRRGEWSWVERIDTSTMDAPGGLRAPAGPLTIEWKGAGGEARSREIVLEVGEPRVVTLD